ncbi:MAG: tetratricopeptide repeat protein [Flavobacteriales bacterium]|nr:tetratricopeptide repeat protein [Flavobacteriales bacterium]
MKRTILYLASFLWLHVQASSPVDSLYSELKDAHIDTIQLQLLNRLCAMERDRGNFDLSDSLASEALQRAVAIHSLKWEAEARINQGNTTQKRGNFHAVLRSRDELRQLVTRANDHRLWGNYHTLMANCHRKMGDLPTAMDAYLKALSFFEQINDLKGMASTYNNMAIVQAAQNRFDLALNYFVRYAEMNRMRGDAAGMAMGHRNQATCLIEMGKLAEARVLADSALTEFRNLENRAQEAALLSTIAIINFKLGKIQEASEYFEAAMKLTDELGMTMAHVSNQISLGGVRIEQQRFTEAKQLIEQGVSTALKLGHKEHIRDGYHQMSILDSAMNNMAAALEHYKLFVLYKDSIFNETSSEQLAEMETRFETERKEQQIVLLNKDKEIKDKEISEQKVLRNAALLGFFIMLLSASVFLLQRNRIKKEKEHSEELLLNILPYETAQELKSKGSADAKMIDMATVLFTDFKGFTALSEQLTPQQLVAEINECFSEFDRICERHNIEKIKTIGDAYMAAGGLPTANSTHAIDVVQAAIEIRDFMAKRNRTGNSRFEIRIGVHTGPVVAGIVGIKKFQYDIWGDTVNIASRMESSGEVGKINISEFTYGLVKDAFMCEYRGEVEAKGKGMMRMYFVQ